ncbi:MAG: DsbA family protein [Candidatus Woesearchaeota archaeon]
MNNKTKDAFVIIIELIVVSGIVLFVLNIGRFFPTPSLPNAVPIVNMTYVEGGVTLTEFSDFECPYCSRASETIRELQGIYAGRINFEFKHFPIHQGSEKAAEASECARDQGKFWEYSYLLFENQNNLGVERLKQFAQDLELNASRFDGCLDSGEKSDVVQADYREGVSLGVQGTPTFFVNDKQIVGAQPTTDFQQVIESELAKSAK